MHDYIITARRQGNVLHMSVILSSGGGGLCMMSLPVWLPGPMFLGWVGGWVGGWGGGVLCLWSHVPMFLPGGRGSLSRGVSVRETPHPRTETPVWQRVGSTHPTGMHSCFSNNSLQFFHRPISRNFN